MSIISIIVPIYNVEKYLLRCIDSILAQTFHDFELILVNDGSPDNSIAICKEYAKKDTRIKIIDKANGGVSSARNAGIKVATGEYIGFVDPDDWIESEMYENMYRTIVKAKSDICICNYVIERSGKTDSKKDKKSSKKPDLNIKPMILDLKTDPLNKNEIIEQIIPKMIAPSDLNEGTPIIMGSVWRLLIKKKLIDDFNLRFPEDINFMEDLVFCLDLFLKAESIVHDRGQYYHYMTNFDSAISRYQENLSKTQEQILNKIENILMGEKLYEVFKGRLNIMFVRMCISSIVNEVHKNNNKSTLGKIRSIKNICKDNRLKEILTAHDTSDFTLKRKMTLSAMEKELSVFLYLYYTFATRIIKR